MKVLRHRKWTLCLVIICFLSFFAPFSLESDMDLGKNTQRYEKNLRVCPVSCSGNIFD